MRLTLRTMLAYLDGILDASDAEVLRKKIDDSDFASGLVNRIRGLMRRVRLGAPKLEGRGMGADPNTVAEYLDNVMASDLVPEFEKVCLESDVHLAEVASCHQILTLVLGGAAPIDAGLRERIYRLGMQQLASRDGNGNGTALVAARSSDGHEVAERPSHEMAEDAEISDFADVREEPTVTPRSLQEAPDYVQAGERRVLWPLVTTLGFFFLLTIVALRAMGPLNATHPLYRFLAKAGPNDETLAQARDDEPDRRESLASEKDLAGDTASVDQVDPRVAARARVTPPVKDDDLPPSERAKGNPAPELSVPSDVASGDVAGDSPEFADSRSTSVPSESDPSLNSVPPPEPPNVVGPVNPEPARPDLVARPGEPNATQVGADPVPPETKAGTEPKTLVAGRFISDAQLLGRMNEEGKGWSRLAPESLLQVGDQFLAFPAYRAQVLLVPGIKVTLAGPTRMQVLASDDEQVPAASIPFGRIVVNTDGKLNSAISLQLGDRRGTAVFPDADSAMAAEVMWYLPPGSNPQSVPAQQVITIYATRGNILWRELDHDPVELTTGDVRVTVDQSPAEVYPTALPDWIEAKSVSPIDLRAARDLEQLITLDRPLELSLREKAEHRQAEVRALAIRCLTYLDVFEPCIQTFAQESQHSYWHQHFDAAQAAMARGDETAQLLQDACQKLRGNEGLTMVRLLRGFSSDDLRGGEAKQLVLLLEHKSLDIRVMALENLRRITSFTKLYRPEKPLDQQKRPLREWKEMVDAGLVDYKVPPSPLPLRKDGNAATPNRTSVGRRAALR